MSNRQKPSRPINLSVIPKEQMTAYQRWELSSFDPQVTPLSNTPPQISAEELQNIKQQAYAEGLQSGHSEGYNSGHEAGYAAGIEQAKFEAAQFHTLLQNMQQGLNEMDEQIAQAMLDMSIEVAKKMVHETITFKPEVILGTIRDAIGSLPQFNQNAHLILHPDDAELVRKNMHEELAHANWKIFTDVKLERGGCLVRTAHSFIEATTEERWKRVMESIGQNRSWLT